MKSFPKNTRPVDGDECGVVVRGMQSSSSFFKISHPVGEEFQYCSEEAFAGFGEGEPTGSGIHAEARSAEDSDTGSGCNAGGDGEARCINDDSFYEVR